MTDISIVLDVSPDGTLPPVLRAHHVASLLSVSVDLVYELVRQDACFVAPVRMGRSLRWPTNAVLNALAIDPAAVTVVSGTQGVTNHLREAS
jgi:predicted DNA-binding transcriptional regulator AlpA